MTKHIQIKDKVYESLTELKKQYNLSYSDTIQFFVSLGKEHIKDIKDLHESNGCEELFHDELIDEMLRAGVCKLTEGEDMGKLRDAIKKMGY